MSLSFKLKVLASSLAAGASTYYGWRYLTAHVSKIRVVSLGEEIFLSMLVKGISSSSYKPIFNSEKINIRQILNNSQYYA